MRNLGFLRWNNQGLRDNLVVDDREVIAEGLTAFHDAGGSGIVDMTNIGLGRQVHRLPSLARETGVHLMIGSGWYREPSHPREVETSTVEALYTALLGELRDGVTDTGIRPAVIGELGTSAPITRNEKKVLVAAAHASAETNAAINVHLETDGGRDGLEVVEILVGEGADPSRIILSHLDERIDLPYHLELADTGVVLEFDTFGMESYWEFPHRDPTDHQRFQHVAELVGRGLADRITLGCDVFCKTAHTSYGGMGYEHLPKRVVPALHQHFGITDSQLETMLVTSPRRLLDRP
jgi:phosphotriesterase-related protein